MGCHFPLQGIFPTQGLNLRLLYLLYWQVGFLPLAPPGKHTRSHTFCLSQDLPPASMAIPAVLVEAALSPPGGLYVHPHQPSVLQPLLYVHSLVSLLLPNGTILFFSPKPHLGRFHTLIFLQPSCIFILFMSFAFPT